MSDFLVGTIVGHLGADPQPLDGQNPVVRLSVASDEYVKSKSGGYEKDDEGRRKTVAHWTSVFCYGQAARYALQYATKWARIYASGALSASIYIDRNGNPQVGTTMSANDFRILSSPRKDGEGRKSGANWYDAAPSPLAQYDEAPPVGEERVHSPRQCEEHKPQRAAWELLGKTEEVQIDQSVQDAQNTQEAHDTNSNEEGGQQ